jgi:hypothetical protein
MFKISDENMATMHNLSKEFDAEVSIVHNEVLRINGDNVEYEDWNIPNRSGVWVWIENRKFASAFEYFTDSVTLAEKLETLRNWLIGKLAEIDAENCRYKE